MRRIIFFLIILLMWPSAGFSQITKQEAISQFVQGNLSYKEGDFKRAIEKYETILKGERASGPLYYNLANTYYRQGNLGKAILNYERARRLTPRDSDLNFNYNYVRSKANLFEGQIGANFIQKALNEHLLFYSLDEMAKILAFIIFLMGLVHLLFLYFSWPKPLRNALLGFLIIVFIIFSWGLSTKTIQETNQAVILKKTQAKFEPKEDSTTHYKLLEGAFVTILREEGGWAKIKRGDGKLGWLPKVDLEEI